MPVYEYYCDDCQRKFDALRPMKDADNQISCKYCNGKNTRRKVTACYSSSDGRSIGPANSGCSGCHGGSCSSCGH